MIDLISAFGEVPVLLLNQENRADLDQTAPYEQSELGLHCFLRHSCPNLFK